MAITTIGQGGFPVGHVLQVEHVTSVASTQYAATTSSGHDILDKSLTTKRANSTFYVHWSICHGVGDNVNNMDSHDMHFFCIRTAGGSDTNVGGNTGLNRNTAGSGTGTNRIYSTDVPFSPRSVHDTSPDYGSILDVFHRSGHFIDSPNLSGGVTNQYRVRMFNQSIMYLNRGRSDATNAGGVSSMVIMEIAV